MFALTLALALTAAPQNASATLETDQYVIEWTAETPVDVYVARSPSGDDAQLVSENDSDGTHTMPRSDTQDRTYFLLRDETGAETVTALRLLPLEGGRNFRDLGGYQTRDGRTVQWGKIYRSGVMNSLTANDYRYLSGLGISVICDFRAASERDSEPTDWQAGEIDYVAWDYEMDPSAFMSAFADGEMSAERSRQAFMGFYRQTPYEFADRYAVMFDRLAEGDLPLAFNCSAGKDRTGVAAALLLSLLEVDRETIVADYALSDDYVDYMAEMQSHQSTEIDPEDPMYAFTQLPPEVIAPFMASDPDYIRAMFDQIETDHGDVQTYLRDVVGVTDAERDAIRAALLH
jgi:protein-tyrosine phosphatase